MNYFFPLVVSFSNNSLPSVWLPWKLLIPRRRRKNWLLVVFVGCYCWLLLTLVVVVVLGDCGETGCWLMLVDVGCHGSSMYLETEETLVVYSKLLLVVLVVLKFRRLM